METYPKISIITPSYNQGQYIEQTIVSVLEQDYPSLEYIVIDGGSTDGTIEVLKKYNDQITYWISEPDKGQTDAINKGFQKATGEIINWINSDDYYAKGTFLNLAASFEGNSTKAVTTTVHNFVEGGEEWDERTGHCTSNIEYIARSFNNQPGTFFKKEVWDKYFPLPVQLRYTMDQYLWFCFWLEHHDNVFKWEDYTTTFFRRHASSKTSASANSKIFNYLGETFFNEHNLLFWSFFSGKDNKKAEIIASYFWNNYDYKSNQISFPQHLEITGSELHKLFHLYLFQLLKEDYKHGFFYRLRANLKYLDTSLISTTDGSIVKRMRLCASNPNAVKNYRRIYWKIKRIVKKP